MTLSSRSFSIEKKGNPPEYNDDSAAADVATGRFAVSDGAAESGFAGVWSRALVRQFVGHSDTSYDDWKGWLPQAQKNWLDELRGVTIPYYGEQQFEQGAFATFLGLVVSGQEEAERDWRVVAVGDSCLFHTRGNELLKSFPLVASKQFDRFPKLIGSRSKVDEIASKRSKKDSGSGTGGDRLWLLSDALARWCFVEVEAERSPWNELRDLAAPHQTDEQFSQWVAEARATRQLENDDVTLLVVEL